MSWTPAALAIALRYRHIFQPLELFEPGIRIEDRHVPTLERACIWLDAYIQRHPDSGIQIIDVISVSRALQISVFPDIDAVDRRMYEIRQKSADSV